VDGKKRNENASMDADICMRFRNIKSEAIRKQIIVVQFGSCLQQQTKDFHVLYTTSAFQAARSCPASPNWLSRSLLNYKPLSGLTFLNCNKFIQRIIQDMLILKLLIRTSLFWPSSSRCRHLFAKGPY
jgi:hypothetical protein